jgi:Raf kinase inhibitor-like YbhB/YbcL family protein
MTVSSSAFADGRPIDKKCTCDGRGVSPALEWRGHPAGTKSFAIICDDPDAPSGTFTHWVLYDIPAATTRLEEGAANAGRAGVNSFSRRGYGGPCPPRGAPHRYFFHVYALDVASLGPAGMSKEDAAGAMKGHVLAEGQVMGTYARAR